MIIAARTGSEGLIRNCLDRAFLAWEIQDVNPVANFRGWQFISVKT